MADLWALDAEQAVTITMKKMIGGGTGVRGMKMSHVQRLSGVGRISVIAWTPTRYKKLPSRHLWIWRAVASPIRTPGAPSARHGIAW